MGRDSERRVQPRQTDAVDQFVAREANGYKAETESFISMNYSEEASLCGTAPVQSISRHAVPAARRLRPAGLRPASPECQKKMFQPVRMP